MTATNLGPASHGCPGIRSGHDLRVGACDAEGVWPNPIRKDAPNCLKESARQMAQTLQKNIRVTSEQWERIEIAAQAREVSANQPVVKLAIEALDRRDGPAPKRKSKSRGPRCSPSRTLPAASSRVDVRRRSRRFVNTSRLSCPIRTHKCPRPNVSAMGYGLTSLQSSVPCPPQGRIFLENAARDERIDYGAAVSGGLQLIPSGAALAALAVDYARMLAHRMALDDTESFDMLMAVRTPIESRTNESQA